MLVYEFVCATRSVSPTRRLLRCRRFLSAPAATVHEVSSCSVAACAEIVGAKWKRFSELRNACPGISRGTLAERLRALEHEQLIVRRTYAEAPPRVEYELTTRAAICFRSSTLCGASVRRGCRRPHCNGGSAVAAGKVTANVVPTPCVERASIEPPIAATSESGVSVPGHEAIPGTENVTPCGHGG
jgi:hypothetical protein